MVKKIIIFSNSSTNIVQLRKNLIKYLYNENYNLTICIPETNNKKIFSFKKKYNFNLLIISTHRSSINLFSNLFYIFQVSKILFKNQYDLILTFTIKPNIFVSLANIFFKKKIINFITGLGSSFLSNKLIKYIIFKLYKLSLSKSNYIIFQNDDDRNIFLKKKIVNNDNSLVIHGSGIDTDEFNYNYKKFDNKKIINYLYAGRLIKDKGIIELLDAFNNLTKKNKNINLIIAGDIDSQNPTKINNDIKRKYNSSNIKFIGKTENIKDLIIMSHFSILLSYREGISNFLLESASIGRPIIATNVPGCKEIVDKKNGYLCEPRNTIDAINNIQISMNINNQDYQKLSSMGRQKILQQFDNKIVITKIINLIKNIF